MRRRERARSRWGSIGARLLLMTSLLACENERRNAPSGAETVERSNSSGRVDSATAVRVARPLVVRQPWADSLGVRQYIVSDSGYTIELVFRESSDPNVFHLGGGVVHVSFGGTASVMKLYR